MPIEYQPETVIITRIINPKAIKEYWLIRSSDIDFGFILFPSLNLILHGIPSRGSNYFAKLETLIR